MKRFEVHMNMPHNNCTTKARPQHRELHALLFTISVWVLLRPLLTIFNTEDAGDGAYGLQSLS